VDLNVTDVPPIGEISEEALNQGMLNGEATVICFEISLGYIRLMLGSVGQYVIPGTVLGWPRTGHGFVPCLGSSKVHIDTDDYTSVVEQFVLHHIAD